ncbi:MAG: hypothetical protein NT013_17600 [Planctomycetia bacterium]|nr:hypothetical protein [Planctomycetia bacterium]
MFARALQIGRSNVVNRWQHEVHCRRRTMPSFDRLTRMTPNEVDPQEQVIEVTTGLLILMAFERMKVFD